MATWKNHGIGKIMENTFTNILIILIRTGLSASPDRTSGHSIATAGPRCPVKFNQLGNKDDEAKAKMYEKLIPESALARVSRHILSGSTISTLGSILSVNKMLLRHLPRRQG